MNSLGKGNGLMANMTLEQLRIFLAVAEQMHFTRAAEMLYMTQSSVSAAIQNLEKHYDLRLFNRVGRRIELTEAGQLLRVEARKILEQVSLTEQGLEELNNLQRGRLQIGASLTIGNYWLPERISYFKQHYPNIEIHCTLGNTDEICIGTINGQFDLGFVEGNLSMFEVKKLECQAISQDQLLIVVGRSHPWFKSGQVTLAELTQSNWVMREPGSGTRAIFEQALCNWGLNLTDLSIVLTMSSGEMVKAIVESGVGATAISELMIQKELKLKRLRPIKIKDLGQATTIIRSFFQLRHWQRFQTRIAQDFARSLVTH